MTTEKHYLLQSLEWTRPDPRGPSERPENAILEIEDHPASQSTKRNSDVSAPAKQRQVLRVWASSSYSETELRAAVLEAGGPHGMSRELVLSAL